jgi:hypothetical protein
LAFTALAADPWAQSAPPGASGAALFKDLRWRNLGPANMAGRVSDIEAVEANPAIVYVGAASGGVWKSVNAGRRGSRSSRATARRAIGDIAHLSEGSEHRLGRQR